MSLKQFSITFIGFTHKIGGGGGTVHLNNLIQKLQTFGVKATILNTVTSDRFDLISVIKSTLQSLFVKVHNLYDVKNCDIILSESPYPPDIILAYRLSRTYRKPVAAYIHHITPTIYIYPFRRGIFRVILNVAYISCILVFLKKHKIPIFLDNPNTVKRIGVSVFPNLIAIGNNELSHLPIESRLDIGCDICYIGRIENHKGIRDLVLVARILKIKYSLNIKMIIAGNGNSKYVAKIKKMINRLGLSENVFIRGYLSEEQKFELLKKSQVFLFLSYEEGWSISVMEAASVGTPIIAYYLPAYYYLQGNYFAVELGNIQLCAETVKKVIDDNSLALKKVIKARECVGRFSYDFIAKQQKIFFERIIKDYGNLFHK